MMNALTRSAILLMGWLALFLIATPDSPRLAALDEGTVLAQSGSSARERWEALSPEQRVRLKERYERFQQLDEKERQALRKRAQELKKAENRILNAMSPKARARLMQQPEEQRRQLLTEMVDAERRSKGRRIEVMLPDDLRRELTRATPEERRVGLEKFKLETRERLSLKIVEETARALGHGQKEINRCMQLPMDERMGKVLEYRKQLTAQQVEESGLPLGWTRERWEKLDSLPPREYFAEIMRLRDAGEFSTPGRPERAEPTVADPPQTAGQRLQQLLKVNPQERLDLSHLSPEERTQELDRRRRERAMKMIREEQLITEKQAGILDAMTDGEFFVQVRRVGMELRRKKRPKGAGSVGGSRGKVETPVEGN